MYCGETSFHWNVETMMDCIWKGTDLNCTNTINNWKNSLKRQHNTIYCQVGMKYTIKNEQQLIDTQVARANNTWKLANDMRWDFIKEGGVKEKLKSVCHPEDEMRGLIKDQITVNHVKWLVESQDIRAGNEHIFSLKRFQTPYTSIIYTCLYLSIRVCTKHFGSKFYFFLVSSTSLTPNYQHMYRTVP